jgi:8-oxo-dGTP pyrophosphatase MutT (NUDIX family)
MVDLRKATMAVIVNSENKFLIGSSPRDGGFKFPQGGLDEGESLFEGIKREVFEEVGLELLDSDIIESFDEMVKYFYVKPHPETGHLGQEQSVFKIKFRDDMVLVPQDDEFDELYWISFEEFEKFDFMHRKTAYLRALELCGLVKEI